MSQGYLLIEKSVVKEALFVLGVVLILTGVVGSYLDEKTRKQQRTEVAQLATRLATLENVLAQTQPAATSNPKTQPVVRTAKHVTVTTYQSDQGQTDSTPHLNALNEPAGPGQCAVSRDLLKQGWSFGKRVYVQGFGVYTISDIMNARFTKRIDIWTGDNEKQDKRTGVLAVLITDSKIH